MRRLSVEEFEHNLAGCLAEVEGGQRLVLIRGGKAIAEVTPSHFNTEQLWKTEEERDAAGDRLIALIEKGYDLGGIRMTNRDELYDRD